MQKPTRRSQEFFASVYAYLLEKYANFLADSRPAKSYKGQTHEPKNWEKLHYMMDSTTITLFDNILKGIGRHPKSSKKKLCQHSTIPTSHRRRRVLRDKMKKNLKYEVLESVMYVNTEGLVAHIDQKVRFTRGELIHEARRVEIFYANKKPVVLLTNHFDFTVEDIAEI